MSDKDRLPWATCSLCDKDVTLVRGGVLRPHGRPSRRCPASHTMKWAHLSQEARRYLARQRAS